MTENPAVSIIMPAYNVEDYIEKSISSVLGQTMHDFELIIVNDGSTDHTHQLMFPEDKKYEDNPFNLIAMFLCKYMVILPYIGYNQVIHDDTTTQHQIKEEQIPYVALENAIKYVLARPMYYFL